jgi:cytochrome c oxidase subunit 1
MRDRPALLRTSSLWLMAMGVLIALQAVEAGSAPVTGGGVGSGPRDTYYVVAPFHAVLPFALMFALFAAFYVWCERAWGARYDDRLGQAHLWATVGGVLLIMAPTLAIAFAGVRPQAFAAWSGLPMIGYVLMLLGLLTFAVTCLRGMWMALRVGEAH